MVRDKLIMDQRSCWRRRHLDSVPPDTPIRVDRCRVWESHSEQKKGSSPDTGGHPECKGVSSLRCLGLMWSEVTAGNPGARSGCKRDASPGMMFSLIARFLRMAQEEKLAEVKVPWDSGIGTEFRVGGRAGDGVFFVWSSGARSETMLPGEYFVSIFATGLGGYCPGWPVSGMVWPSGPTARGQSGNEGWSGREGQPPRPVVAVGLLAPAEGAVLPWLQETVRPGNHRWDMRTAPGGRPVYRVFPHWGVINRWFQRGNASGLGRKCVRLGDITGPRRNRITIWL